MQLLAGNAGTDVERQKRRIFTAGNHLRHGVMTKGFRPCRAGIKRAAMGSDAKRWKDLFIYGWLAVISCVLTVLLGTGDSAAGA